MVYSICVHELDIVHNIEMNIQWLNFLAVVAAAMSGSLLGVRKRFDLFGVLVLGCVTSVGGGAIRDTLTGQTPPLFLREESYLWFAILGSLLGFVFGMRLAKVERTIRIFDLMGLALFAASGAVGAVQIGLGPLGVIFVGMLSGVGGGVIRDLIANEVPEVMYRKDQLYATAAAAGALVVWLLFPYMSTFTTQLLGSATVVLVQMISRAGWIVLPVRRLPEEN